MNARRRPIGDLGRRVELVSMDRHHGDISVGLYLREDGAGPVASVRSFSGAPGVPERLARIAATMRALGGLEQGGDPASVRFACAAWHATAAKRLFLEACKHDPAEPATARPRTAPDSRTGQTIAIEPLGGGAYAVHAHDVGDGEASRAPAIARAIAKLAQLDAEDGSPPIVRFACGAAHDELIGLLLVRAQNLRAVLREEEMQASRGVLAAPSARE